jgi:hypothetical protein
MRSALCQRPVLLFDLLISYADDEVMGCGQRQQAIDVDRLEIITA